VCFDFIKYYFRRVVPMLKRIAMFLTCFTLLASLAACGSAKDDGPVTINVFNWGDYIHEDVLTMFTEETGINVNYDMYATNEDMYTKIKSGGSEYDVLFPSDYMIEKLIKEDMLAELDFKNIPNISEIDGRFRNPAYDPDEKYSVPYMWGTLGILYNTTMVDEEVNSWSILWDEKYADNIFMYDSQRDSIGMALLRLGYSLNTTNLDELNEAKATLIAQKPLVRAYMGDNVKDSMIGGEAALAFVYSGDALFCMEENEDLAYAIPQENTNIFYDGIVVTKNTKHKAEAEAFINFLCRPDIALMNTEYIGYSTVNAGAYKLLPEEVQNDPVYWTPDDVFARGEVFLDLGDFLDEYNKAWTEILASQN
jgi:spermidine/putrescine transport system substrate-binding protein